MSKENLEEFAYTSIIRLILENHFKIGDFLLETELSKALDLSRTPVRHALGQLVAEGFLDKKKKKGCFIPPVSSEDARHVFFVRKNIEGLTASSAARHATDEDIDFLWGLIKEEKELYQNFSKMDYVNINMAFHMGIARISQNKYLEKYCRHSFCRSHTYIFFYDDYYTGALVSGIQETSPKQHIQIVEAIENRNEEKAGNLMRQHVRTTFEQLFVKL
ncbi:MAG: GntR family transcriptional regulator [Desulfobacula sp.]|uniref:GntR family transcriptional regulator n=1 Tax=Desulfobacula sp. TaxID=2593537 RepID=UPI0025BC809D|nr:GntR family transcriptional regulator [Desulfobacula sp.]MCD4722808.1 GntR family transcriptional regulator [Desulfobacula sp.]